MLEHWKTRFLEHMERHPGLSWETAEQRLSGDPQALETLRRMEASGGDPDTLGWTDDGRLLFCDCAPESPAGRRSLCYDEEARRSRRKNPPVGSAAQQAWEMGVELMPEALYLRLQTLDQFDLKSSSWIATPPDIRSRGGALFCERRYGRVFTFHNGADSYYAVRGWRGYLII